MSVEHNIWYLKTIEEVITEIRTSKTTGLDDQEVKKRETEFGLNKISDIQSFKWYSVLFEKFNSLLIYILFAASLIAYFSGEVLEFIIIIVIILMTVFLGFIQEYKADKTMKALNDLTAKKVLVLRNGKKKEIDATQLVLGDIVYLKRGTIVPADIRLIETSGLQVNESNITGESKERTKHTKHLVGENISLGDMDNMVFSSTHVICGSGVGIVVETGLHTVIGKISSSIQHIKSDKSPIQKKIDKMSKKISYIVLSVAVLLFVILMLKGNDFYFGLILVSAVAISGIPESFPLALTLTFSHGIKKMAKKNALVKDLNSVETLGTTTVICTDKTGTLTENKMRVSKLILPTLKTYMLQGSGYEPVNEFFDEAGKPVKFSNSSLTPEFTKAAILCNDSELNHLEDGSWTIEGEPTEGSLLVFAKSLDADEELIREDNKRVFTLPFDPLKKFMVVVTKHMDKKSILDFSLKGAGEIVLEKCSHYRDAKQTIKKLTPELRKKLIKELESCNKSGLRVLSIATKSVKLLGKSEDKLIKTHIEKNYVFEGFLGIEDPIRTEVFKAVAQCQESGIKIVMITGDHKLIAESIGKKLGLVTDSAPLIMQGLELDKLSDDELDDIITKVSIFARATPEHKLRIVNSFQRKGEIVAMTGDGVNDAPALKKADIGVAMGKNGTEVAREASNMILTDDNFATIVNAVQEGRTVYNNIRRFIYYLLTGNFTEVALIVFAVILGLSLPLTALMILFINLVTSTIPALALSVEPTHYKVMRQRPRSPNERLLSSYILTKILVTLPFLLFGTLGLFMWQLLVAEASLEKAMTVAFASLIVFELFHAFNARKMHTTIFDKGFFMNPYIFWAVGASTMLTLLSIYTPIGQAIFSTVPLFAFDWFLIILVSSSVVAFTEIIKFSIQSEVREQSTLQGVKMKVE